MHYVSIPIWCDYKLFVLQPCICIFLFQFQYGAIIREYRIAEITASSLFQFQYGAIIRLESYIDAYKNVKFQFQYGAIISLTFDFIFGVLFLVSIPIWCDYKLFRI